MKQPSCHEMFGDPSDFAIEASVEPYLVPPSAVWGCLRVWCGGAALGDIEERHCALHASFRGLSWRAAHIDELWDEACAGLNDQALWNLLDGAIYGWHGDVKLEDERSLDELRRDAQRFGKFDFLTNWGEQFDGGYKSFLLHPSGQTMRVLSRAFPQSIGLGVNVSRACFLAATREFVKWFESQNRRLSEDM